MRAAIVCLVLAIIATAAVASPQGHPQGRPGRGEDRTRLKFKVSARGLKDKDTLGTTDPYVNIYYTENEGTGETKLGRSETLSNNRNPDWSDIFNFEFDRYKRQRWHFVVKDHDLLRRDDKAGEAWVTVSDFVDSDQHLQVNLNKKGYLIIKRA